MHRHCDTSTLKSAYHVGGSPPLVVASLYDLTQLQFIPTLASLLSRVSARGGGLCVYSHPNSIPTESPATPPTSPMGDSAEN
ncbi:MAG: hypothetical protein AB7O48_16475 [Cyclobacteriaceae bacterium]